MRKVRGFVMRTGETVLGEILEEEVDGQTQTYTVVKPAVLVPDQQSNVKIIKWNPFVGDDWQYVLTQLDFVGQPFEPLSALADAYLQATSGLQLATPDQIQNVKTAAR